MLVSETAAVFNTAISFLIVLTLSFYRRCGANHRPWVSWLAWLVVVVYGSVPIRYLEGHYHEANWLAVIANLIVCAALLWARGNLARIVDLGSRRWI